MYFEQFSTLLQTLETNLLIKLILIIIVSRIFSVITVKSIDFPWEYNPWYCVNKVRKILKQSNYFQLQRQN